MRWISKVLENAATGCGLRHRPRGATTPSGHSVIPQARNGPCHPAGAQRPLSSRRRAAPVGIYCRPSSNSAPPGRSRHSRRYARSCGMTHASQAPRSRDREASEADRGCRKAVPWAAREPNRGRYPVIIYGLREIRGSSCSSEIATLFPDQRRPSPTPNPTYDSGPTDASVGPLSLLHARGAPPTSLAYDARLRSSSRARSGQSVRTACAGMPAASCDGPVPKPPRDATVLTSRDCGAPIAPLISSTHP